MLSVFFSSKYSLFHNSNVFGSCIIHIYIQLTYRTANLWSCILYIYPTNIGAEYFKHGVCSPFFSLQNAVCFIILTYLVPVLFTFYIQGVPKLKNNSGAKRLICIYNIFTVSVRLSFGHTLSRKLTIKRTYKIAFVSGRKVREVC